MKNKLNNVYKYFKNKKLIKILMATITYSSLCITDFIQAYDLNSWLFYIILLILFVKTDIYNKKLKKEILILTMLFSFLSVYGKLTYSLIDNSELSLFKELISFKCLLEFIGIFNLIYIILVNLIPNIYTFNIYKNIFKYKKKRSIFLVSFIVIIICWVPYFLTFFPGTLSPDSLSELSMVINNFSNLTDHHPVAHILFISIPFKLGLNIFGSITAGVALTTITQMIILAIIFSYTITFLYKRHVSDIVLLITLIFYAILPVHGYYSIAMWKDVIFAGLLLLLTLETIKIIELYNKQKLYFKKIVPFTIISILCIFFRNNAIYMYAILSLVTLILLKKTRMIFIISFSIIFSIYFLIKGPIFSNLNISTSPSAEYLAMPLQQVGRMAFKNVNFTEEEQKILNKLIPIDIMASVYNPYVVDNIKFNEKYNSKEFDKNKSKYLLLWLNLVLKNPGIAIESYSVSTLGYWYPGVNYWAVMDYISDNEYNLKTETKAPWLMQRIIHGSSSKNIPILNMEWSIGMSMWIILLFGVLGYKKNKLFSLYPLIPSIGIWITMMLASPVLGEFRYVYCIIVCIPILILLPYLNLKNKY